MIDVTDDMMAVDPEMERIWREDDEPSFTDIRKESEQPDDTATAAEDSDDLELDDNEDDTDIPEETEVKNDDSKADDEVDEEVELDKPESYKIKANDKEFDLSLDELKALAPKAMDYTKKMQEIAPWRKTISALKEQGLGETDVNLMIDVLKGDKNAIAEVLKRTGVDALELDDAKETYVPNQYGKDENTQRIDDIISQISSDEEFKVTSEVVDNQWDSKSRTAMAQNPDMILGLHADIKNGVYDKVSPIALKLKALDGGRLSDVEYYIEAGKQYYAKVETAPAKQTETKEMAPRRKAAAPTKTMSGKRDVVDYLNDSDEEFDEWYKSTMSKQ